MRYLKTYRGNIKAVENKVNLLYKSEIADIIAIKDTKLSINKNRATAAISLEIKVDNEFMDCSHINTVRLEKYKRSRILYFTIDDGREFKLVMSNRFLFSKTTGIYYNNLKVGKLTFKNNLSITNLKNIVIDFFRATGILISVMELQTSLKSNMDNINDVPKRLVY
ncbi:hypothetical protein [Clostridium massiliamazoniense]|uniref:hypothetical protein n=1 Tax=Clostridium massiliamazoniense TaxID=1347366 RepID=UPI0006D82E88|nr:hypothetical protein [Clostridium massiliamazoniense]